MSEDAHRISTTAERFRRLYTGLVADTLDELGFRQQTLSGVAPIIPDMTVAGPAFPGRGEPTDDPAADDTTQRLAMLESVTPGAVSIWACGGHTASAHWGEIMSRSVMERGCVGAVVDGGLRDTRFVLDLDFPVFCGFRHPASSIGRWDIVEWDVTIAIGDTAIHPGDWVFGDIDGVVVVPRERADEVLGIAEAKAEREVQMRSDLANGVRPSEVHARYGRF